MMTRRCNIRILEETKYTFKSVRRSLTPHTTAAVSRALRAAQAAASRGRCAEMHRYAQDARGLLDRRLDALLGTRR